MRTLSGFILVALLFSALEAQQIAGTYRQNDLTGLGHAVEKHYGYRRVLHGEAVSMGMVYAARRSEDLALAPAGTAERLESLLAAAGLPTELPRFAREAYLAALRVDKKKRDRRIQFVVLRRIGLAATRRLTPEQVYPARA